MTQRWEELAAGGKLAIDTAAKGTAPNRRPPAPSPGQISYEMILQLAQRRHLRARPPLRDGRPRRDRALSRPRPIPWSRLAPGREWQLTEASKASWRLTLLICEHTYTSTHQALRWKQATSRAMLLHVRFGTTVPQAAKSGAPPCSRSVMCRTTGTERLIASNSASGPSTFAKGVRTPPANQTSVLTAVRIDAPFLVRQGSDRA